MSINYHDKMMNDGYLNTFGNTLACQKLAREIYQTKYPIRRIQRLLCMYNKAINDVVSIKDSNARIYILDLIKADFLNKVIKTKHPEIIKSLLNNIIITKHKNICLSL